ncbi:MAG: phosphomethylpyrimidine synthase ThiC [Marinilabiliales bacterium]|nr:phosphomethylpyrimidine synthase ThiC [Marinilabiliales bacterium]
MPLVAFAGDGHRVAAAERSWRSGCLIARRGELRCTSASTSCWRCAGATTWRSSLGDGLRPGLRSRTRTTRRSSRSWTTLGELVPGAREQRRAGDGRGPGHVPLHLIPENVERQRRVCDGAPFYVLGPLVTDVAAGYDHIAVGDRRRAGGAARRGDAVLRDAARAPRAAGPGGRAGGGGGAPAGGARGGRGAGASGGAGAGPGDVGGALPFRLGGDVPPGAGPGDGAALAGRAPGGLRAAGRLLLDVRSAVLRDASVARTGEARERLTPAAWGWYETGRPRGSPGRGPGRGLAP